ncbi:MAG: hypothetical protein WDN24_12585 [Sphingomonas sp.]
MPPKSPATCGSRSARCRAAGYALEVEDRGRGIVPGAVHGTGFGARLIEMMAARLGGTHGYHDARPGTRFALRVDRRRA